MVHTLCFILVSCASVTLLLIFMYICNSTFWCSFFCKLGLPQFHLWSKQGRWWTQSCFYSRPHARQVTVDSQSTARSLPRAPSWFHVVGPTRVFTPPTLSCYLFHVLFPLTLSVLWASGRPAQATDEAGWRAGKCAAGGVALRGPGGAARWGGAAPAPWRDAGGGGNSRFDFFFLFFVAIFYKKISTRILLWFSMQTFFFKFLWLYWLHLFEDKAATPPSHILQYGAISFSVFDSDPTGAAEVAGAGALPNKSEV